MLSSVVLIAAGYLLDHRKARERRPGRRRCSMMARMMKAMPEDSPPRVMASTLPRLREQNDEILALLKEQNALLRESQRRE